MSDLDQTDTTTSDVRTWRDGLHPVNVGHLVMGVAFAGLTMIWALYMSNTVSRGSRPAWPD